MILITLPRSRDGLANVLPLRGCLMLVLAGAYVALSFLGACVIVSLRCLLNDTSIGLVVVVLQLRLTFLRIVETDFLSFD